MFKLRLQNYRGFLNQEFDFSRINILIGENSGGKSSILKFLLALQKSLRGSEAKEYNLTLFAEDIDLGNYHEVIFGHDVEKRLGFAFEFGTDYLDYVDDFLLPPKKSKESKTDREFRNSFYKAIGNAGNLPTTLEYKLSKDLGDHSAIETTISNKEIGTLSIVYKSDATKKSIEDIGLRGAAAKCSIHFHSVSAKNSFIMDKVDFDKQGFMSLVSGTSLSERLAALKVDKFQQIYLQMAFLLIAQNFLQLHLARLEYTNPLISPPAERVYLERDRKTIKRIGNIRELVDYLSTNADRVKFAREFKKTLKKYGIADGVRVEKEGFTKELRVTLKGIESNIRDVGFGVSLQLPIFAQAIISDSNRWGNADLQLAKGDTLLVEQPEVHLHPRLQAKFIDALLGIGGNNMFIVETHSEHILRMLQIIVSKGRHGVKASDVSIYYFQKHGKQTKAKLHRILDDSGKLKPNFPKGFYDVTYDLAFSLMR